MNSVASVHAYLNPEFVSRLGELALDASRPNWWRDVLSHKDLILAVRRNYINVYYRGASLFKIELKEKQVVPVTHVKYLVRPNQVYVALRGGQFQLPPSSLWGSYEGKQTLEGIIRVASGYAGAEKTALHRPLIGAAHLIDIEVSLPRATQEQAETDQPGEDTGAEMDDLGRSTRRQDRLDAVAVHNRKGQPTVVFYEAKHFSNAALRSGNGIAPVVQQIRDYEKALEKHRDELERRYLETANALVRFNELRKLVRGDDGVRALDPTLERVAEEGILPVIDPEPRLIIFGYDQSQRNNADSEGGHFSKLRAELGKERVIAVGNPTASSNLFR